MPKPWRAHYSGIFRYACALLQPHHANIIKLILPNGRLEGNEYIALNPTRNDQSLGSFKFNIQTGCWADFASGDTGKDIISIYAYISGKKKMVALAELLHMIGI